MRKLKLPTTLLSFLTLFLFVLFVTATKVDAAQCFNGVNLNLGDCLLLGTGGQSVADVYRKPADLINLVVNNIFVAGGVILLAMVIYAGFQFIGGEKKGAEQAKSVLSTALLGFGIMFISFWVLRIVRLITGADILF